MASTSHIEWLDKGVMLVRVEGAMTVNEFTEYTHNRIRFADEHQSGDYVVVFDLAKASIKEINLRVSQWSANADLRMIHVIIVGKAMAVQVVVNMLARLGVAKIEFANTIEAAKARAKEVLQKRALVE
jgi:hypothetical protein